MTERSFTVHGVPATKGSKSVGRHGQMYEQQSHRLKDWMMTVAYYALQARRGATFNDCGVELMFRIGKRDLDVDKLARAVLDALQQSGMLRDDKYVLRLCAAKALGHPVQEQGCDITIRSVE